MSETRIAVIGCGRIAFGLERDPLRYKPCTHLGALKYLQQKDKQLRLVAFCDTELARARGAGTFAGNPAAMTTRRVEDVLRLRPDLLVVAADTASHFEILMAALKTKIPRIIIEKPVAFSAHEARQLRKLALRSDSIILPNYERRYHVKYLALKKKIGHEALSYRGFFAAGGRSLYPDKKSGNEGVLLHDTTHLLDLAQFFFGAVSKQRVIAGRRRHVLFLEHESGISGTIETALGVGAFHLELEIHTRKERIVVGNGFLTQEKVRQSPHYRGLKSYATPVRTADRKFPVAKNPFVQLYKSALYGQPDNTHFFEAIDNASILAGV